MHTLNRLTVITVLGLGLVPLGTLALLSQPSSFLWSAGLVAGDHTALRESFSDALEAARSSYRHRAGASALESGSKKIIEETRPRLTALAREKRALRFRLAAAYRHLQSERNQSLALAMTQERALRLFGAERTRFGQFIHDLALRRLAPVASGASAADGILRMFNGTSLGDRVSRDLAEEALARARGVLFLTIRQMGATSLLAGDQLRTSAGEEAESVTELQAQLADLQDQYRAEQSTLDHAERMVALTADQLQEVKRIVAEVHDQVLALQSELARIDARIARRAERALIKSGLLSARPGEHAAGTLAGGPQFSWPARGRVSAGFHDAGYFEHFGVPHEGMDIVVPQGTPIRAAADGVVFVVKDGGATGYTYVLIGHQSGFATLYGHLSAVSVYPGQDISKSETIGLSGGTPGTPGAGLMTTAAHFHFEVISRGENVDPRGVLP